MLLSKSLILLAFQAFGEGSLWLVSRFEGSVGGLDCFLLELFESLFLVLLTDVSFWRDVRGVLLLLCISLLRSALWDELSTPLDVDLISGDRLVLLFYLSQDSEDECLLLFFCVQVELPCSDRTPRETGTRNS